jgi:hypothetical protein
MEVATMSRWPAFALVGIVALAAGIGLSQIRSNIAQDRTSGAGSSGNAPGATEDELVQRLVTSPFNPSGKEQGVQLLRGALPSQPKVDVPMPQGAKLIGSVVRTSAGTPINVMVLLDAPGTAADVTTFYEKELTALGWKAAPDRSGPPQGGFQQTPTATSKTFCKGDGLPWVSLTIWPKDKAPNDVRLSHQLQNEFPGGGTPCSQQGFGPQPFQSKLPALRAPSDVQFRSGGGMGSGPDRQTSETSAVTARSASDLETFFEGQLAAAGWTRTGSGGSGPIAWSAWRVPGEGDWTGLLFVLETGSDKRLLSIRAEAATAR